MNEGTNERTIEQMNGLIDIDQTLFTPSYNKMIINKPTNACEYLISILGHHDMKPL